MVSRKELKKKAKQFYQSLNGEIHFSNIKRYIELLDGKWKIYFYNQKDSPGDELIQSIHLTEYAKSMQAFCYCSDKYHFIFIKDHQTEEKTCSLLLHEAAHIILAHLPRGHVFSNTDAIQEKESDRFVHYVTRLRYRKTNAIKATLLALLVAAVLFLSVQINHSHKLVYVTDSGHKYHTKNCIFVRDKANVHKMEMKEAEKFYYTPCQVCIGKDR